MNPEGISWLLAERISAFLHSQDQLRPLAWHMARGISERLAEAITPEQVPAPSPSVDA